MKFLALWFLSIGCPFLISCEPAQKKPVDEIKLTVYRIIDGDSFEGRVNGQTYRIRLFGIDAPEKGQDFYQKSKDRLGQLCKEAPLSIKIRNKDYFGRWVGDAFTSKGIFINQVMVKEGLAWHFTKYSNDPTLKKLERDARDAQIGIWSIKDPIAPWDYRKNKKTINRNVEELHPYGALLIYICFLQEFRPAGAEYKPHINQSFINYADNSCWCLSASEERNSCRMIILLPFSSIGA